MGRHHTVASEIKVPTAVVNGRYDWQSGSLDPAFELVEGIGTSSHVLNQSGHMPEHRGARGIEYGSGISLATWVLGRS